MILRKKVALIIGGGRGIGKITSIKMANEGMKVIVADINKQKIEELSKEYKGKRDDFLSVVVDVSKKGDIDDLVKLVINKFKKVDILVNCAAVTYRKPLLKTREDEWDREFSVNIKGVFLSCKAAAKEMIKQRSGKIINIASINGIYAIPNSGAYGSSKAGVIIFSRIIALELAKYNIYVNSISPGIIDDELTNYCFKAYSKMENISIEKIKNTIIPQIPLNRFGKPEEVAELIMFLASDKSDYITGENFVISGGLAVRYF